MRRFMTGIVATVLFLFLTVMMGAAQAAETYNIDFSDVDIRKVIETVSEITGRNFLVDDRVQGRVTVVGPKALTEAEIYQVFLSVLQMKGFALVPSGKLDKIVPTANISTYGIQMKVGKSNGISGVDAYITQIIPVQYTDAEGLKNLLTPLLPKTDTITSYNPTNLLIITTTESLLSRLNKIIAIVDVPGAREEVRIIPVQYASVEELANKVTQVLQSQMGSPAAARRSARREQPTQEAASAGKVIADVRTNSLIAIADSQTLEEIEDLVRKLDVSVPLGAGKVHVYYLQNADAEELANVLSGIPLEESVVQTEVSSEQRTPRPVQRPQGATADISIIADTSTNALVITSTGEEFEAIKAVIEKLDIPREQVLVEVLIAEVSFTKTLELGVEWRIADDLNGDAAVFTGTSYGAFNELSVSFPSLPDGMAVGAIGETITFGEYEFPNLGALITALKTDQDVNILSTPTIVTMDNREAEIIVGQTVPFQTSQKFDANNQPIYTFDYRDVGLTLRLTPQINSDKFVKMDIYSKLEALVTNTSGTQELAPTTLKRQANTTVVVKDSHTVVIGGMIREDKVKNVSAVPLLGSLPLLGPLFRSEDTTSEKTNLLIFMTPHVISGSDQLQGVARERIGTVGDIPEQVRNRMNLGGEEEKPDDEGGQEETP
jgi:general secretion pathway protein D